MENDPPADLRHTRRQRVNLVDPSTIDRLPPHSLEAEQGVLGCIMLAPNECLPFVLSKLQTFDAFYDLRHRTIMEMMTWMVTQGLPIDTITLQSALKDKQQLDGVGGLSFLSALPDAVPSAANLQYYLDIVMAKHKARRLIRVCTGIVSRTYEHEGDVDQLTAEAETEVMAIARNDSASTLPKIRDLVRGSIEYIEDQYQNRGERKLLGLATGFLDIDRMTSGLKNGELILIAGRPSMGKTSLAMNMAEAVALDQHQPVGIFSIEMTAESLVTRMIASRSRVNMRNVRDGFLADRDFPKITNVSGKIANAPIYIDDRPKNIVQLEADARQMISAFGIKLFIIDYIQIVQPYHALRAGRTEQVTEISNGVKRIAKSNKVPVIGISQLNRESDKDKGRRPKMADLRESGSLEQDADEIHMLYKPNFLDEADEAGNVDREAVAVRDCIVKQRNGPTGDVDLTFLKSYTRFESAAKITADDVPGGEI